MPILENHVYCNSCHCYVHERVSCSDPDCTIDTKEVMDDEDEYVRAPIDFHDLEDRRDEEDDPMRHYEEYVDHPADDEDDFDPYEEEDK
jgi:hypothetical protein